MYDSACPLSEGIPFTDMNGHDVILNFIRLRFLLHRSRALRALHPASSLVDLACGRIKNQAAFSLHVIITHLKSLRKTHFPKITKG